MSVESWARRASGLLVPTAGFANHPLGRFQPCVGPCCEEGVVCNQCLNNLAPEQLEVTVTGVTSGLCNCSSLNGTFVLDWQGGYSCTWCVSAGGGGHCFGSYFVLEANVTGTLLTVYLGTSFAHVCAEVPRATYTKYVGVKPDCFAFVDEELTRQSDESFLCTSYPETILVSAV